MSDKPEKKWASKPCPCGRRRSYYSSFARCRLCRKLNIHLETLADNVKEWLTQYEAKLAAMPQPKKKKARKAVAA